MDGLAAWMGSLYTKASWLAAHPNHHQLLQLEFFSVLNFVVDLLHVKYLGTDMYYLGSTLWLLCYVVLPGTQTLKGKYPYY